MTSVQIAKIQEMAAALRQAGQYLDLPVRFFDVDHAYLLYAAIGVDGLRGETADTRSLPFQDIVLNARQGDGEAVYALILGLADPDSHNASADALSAILHGQPLATVLLIQMALKNLPWEGQGERTPSAERLHLRVLRELEAL